MRLKVSSATPLAPLAFGRHDLYRLSAIVLPTKVLSHSSLFDYPFWLENQPDSVDAMCLQRDI